MPEKVKKSDLSNSSLSLSKLDNTNTFTEKQELNITTANYELTISAYHQSEIQQNDNIYKTAKGIIWAGFIVICIGILLAFFDKTTPAIITATSGVITQFISGALMFFITQSSKTKLEYFKQLSFDTECNKYIEVINDLNEKNKFDLLTKLIDNYHERRKPQK